MKQLLLISLCFPFTALGQQTYVPDDDFEQHLINEGYDNVLDDFVQTSAIDTVSVLYLGFFISNISDLTGLEDFALLKELTIGSNLNLTTLDVSQNTLLESLICSGNHLTNLDIAANTALFYLDCSNNQLTSLDVRNGNNTNIPIIHTSNNPNLSCIDVDDVAWSNSNWTTDIDPQHYFSHDCNTTNAISELFTKSKLIKVVDVFGRETIPELNTLIFYIYEDGKIEKNIILESY